MRHMLVRLVLGLGLFAAAPAWAQGIDMSKGGPIDVTARDGIEWRQNEQVVIARGDARAVRGNVTVIADTLIAHYRKKATAATAAGATAAPAATPVAATAPGAGGPDTGDNEIYRLEADGNVKIFTPTDIAVGDHAIYDIDQAVLILTGKNMSLTTPSDVFTARDTMEWWSQKHMAVGRGLATVTTADGRRLDGDILVGYTEPDGGNPGPAPGTTPGQPPPKPAQPAPNSGDLLGSTGKLKRVEAFGHVIIRTATETITGERAVYVAETGMARVAGHVHITRGQNQADGDEALTNMKTGVSTLIHDPGGRVQGIVVPNDATFNSPAKAPPAAKK